MVNSVDIFCENCGSPIKAQANQQYAKCNSCGTVVSNPKYVEQQQTSNNVQMQSEVSVGGIKGFFKKLGSMFSSNVHHSSGNFNHPHGGDVFFNGGHHHDNPFDNRGHGFGVHNSFGAGYYAVIKKSAFSYSGECPGISFTSVSMCDTYEECLSKIEEKLGDRVGSFNTRYDQPDPRSLHIGRDERIVRVIPRR